jgi:hypothetical protein
VEIHLNTGENTKIRLLLTMSKKLTSRLQVVYITSEIRKSDGSIAKNQNLLRKSLYITDFIFTLRCSFDCVFFLCLHNLDIIKTENY